VKAWIALCDYAQVHAGKIYIVGGGVSVVYLPIQFGIAVEVLVPWTLRSRRVNFRVDLVDSDSRPVMAPSVVANAQPGPLQVGGAFEVVPPSGITEGNDIPYVFAFTVNNLSSLQPSHDYSWRLFLNDEEEVSAKRTFTVTLRPQTFMPLPP
jgi:hypothetical protein